MAVGREISGQFVINRWMLSHVPATLERVFGPIEMRTIRETVKHFAAGFDADLLTGDQAEQVVRDAAAAQNMLAAVKVGQEPCFITFTPDNQYALVVNHRSGDLAVIRLATITQGGSQRRSRTAPLFTMVPVGVGPVSALASSR